MDDSFWDFLDSKATSPSPLAYTLIALSAGLEYVFPPFPGDTVTLFAGFLLGARPGWSFAGIFLAVNGGAVAGATLDWLAGRWLGASGMPWRHRGPRPARLARAIDRCVAAFERHGALYLVLNRFLPSLRALLFVAAGAARLPYWKVLVCGLLSSFLWNGAILLVGRAVGFEKDRLLAIFRTYSVSVWILLAVAALAIVIAVRRRRRRPPEDETPEPPRGARSDGDPKPPA